MRVKVWVRLSLKFFFHIHFVTHVMLKATMTEKKTRIIMNTSIIYPRKGEGGGRNRSTQS